MAVSTAQSSRINDETLVAFTLRLYESKQYNSNQYFWAWSASKSGCNGKPDVQLLGVTVSDLENMKRIIDRHICMVREYEKSREPQSAADADEDAA